MTAINKVENLIPNVSSIIINKIKDVFISASRQERRHLEREHKNRTAIENQGIARETRRIENENKKQLKEILRLQKAKDKIFYEYYKRLY